MEVKEHKAMRNHLRLHSNVIALSAMVSREDEEAPFPIKNPPRSHEEIKRCCAKAGFSVK